MLWYVLEPRVGDNDTEGVVCSKLVCVAGGVDGLDTDWCVFGEGVAGGVHVLESALEFTVDALNFAVGGDGETWGL